MINDCMILQEDTRGATTAKKISYNLAELTEGKPGNAVNPENIFFEERSKAIELSTCLRNSLTFGARLLGEKRRMQILKKCMIEVKSKGDFLLPSILSSRKIP